MRQNDPGGDSGPLEAFEAFHAENPHVYKLFKRFAFRVIAAGRRRYSARTIWHRMRWHADFETTDDEYKLNNNHSPYYGRLFMADHPEHDGLFATRGGDQ